MTHEAMETKKKYRLTKECITHDGHTLYRIEAVRDFDKVKAGDKGGWVESECNLSHGGSCWVCDNAKVFGDARVSGDATVYGGAIVCDNAVVYGNARVCGNARFCGKANVYGNEHIKGDAIVRNNSDYILFKNWWSSGRYFTWTRSNNMWCVGCFYGTGDELIAKAYQDSELSGREYERVVNYVKSILEET